MLLVNEVLEVKLVVNAIRVKLVDLEKTDDLVNKVQLELLGLKVILGLKVTLVKLVLTVRTVKTVLLVLPVSEVTKVPKVHQVKML